MDRRERWLNLTETLRMATSKTQANIWTALPGYILSYDATKMIASVQVTIQMQLRVPNGSWSNVTLPPLLDCPVHFPAGGNYVLTFPIAVNDEVLVVFSSRCIDAWWQSGGVQPQAELRMHDLSDGFVIPKVWSQPNKISNVSTSTAQLRTVDGTAYVELAPSGVVNIVAPGGFNVTAPTAAFSGAVAAKGEGTFNNGHTVSGHTHGGVQSGGSNTSIPTG